MDFQQSDQSTDSTALPFSSPQPNKNNIIPAESTPNRLFPWFGGYFSLAQWQELELQALIYKYMMAGISVPLELILPLKRNIFNALPYYNNSQQYQYLQPVIQQSGYWARYAIDPEPGRCKRTDGKKWRCSRDVVAGQKYCDRHVHRGRNRSRKLVEVSKLIPDTGLKSTAILPPLEIMTKDSEFMESRTLPAFSILPLNRRAPDDKTFSDNIEGSTGSNLTAKDLQRESKPEGRVPKRFFDDWNKSEQESTINSSTNLSISIPGNHHCPSDFSLKLYTGNGSTNGCDKIGEERVMLPTGNWSAAWESHGEASMGGPLAEVLRSSSVSTSSPTSVLCKLNGSVSETCSISN